MKQHLIPSLAATVGLAVGSLATSAFLTASQPQGALTIESLKVGGIINVDAFEHETDGYEGSCTTKAELIQSISTDESLTGSIEIWFKNAAQSEHQLGNGYVKNGEGSVVISPYDYGKKSCEFESAKDYEIKKVIFATVKPHPLFVGGGKE